MPTLFRWLFYGFLSRALGIMMALLGIFFIIEAFDKARYLGHGLTGALFIEYMLLKAPFMVAGFMPVILLLAAAVYLTDLSRHNEIVVMRAAGLGIPKVLLPLLFVAGLATVTNFIIGEWVTPVTNKRMDVIERVHIRHQMPDRQGIQWLKEGNRFFRLQPLAQDTFHLIILETDARGLWLKRTDAARARYVSGKWRLSDVHVSEPVRGSGMRMRHLNALDVPASIGPDTADPPSPRHMSFLELRQYANDLARAGLAAASYRFALHRKFAAPIACLIMVMLATALCTQLGSRGSFASWGILASIVLGLLFYVMGNMSSLLATGERLPAAFAAWLPDMIFGGLAGFLLLYREGY